MFTRPQGWGVRQSDRPVIRNFVTVIGEQSVVSEAELETVVPTSLRESREQRGGDEASTPSDGPQRPARTRPGSSPDGLLPRPALAPLSCAKSAPSPSHRMRVRVPSGQTAEPLSLRLLAVGPDRCARRPGASAALLQALPFIFRVPRGAPSPRSRRLALSRKDSRETSAGLSCCLVPSDPALPWGIRPCVGGCRVGQPSSSSRPDTARRLPRGGSGGCWVPVQPSPSPGRPAMPSASPLTSPCCPQAKITVSLVHGMTTRVLFIGSRPLVPLSPKGRATACSPPLPWEPLLFSVEVAPGNQLPHLGQTSAS